MVRLRRAEQLNGTPIPSGARTGCERGVAPSHAPYYTGAVVASPVRSTCYRCFRPSDFCLCGVIPRVENRTPVLIVQHPRERTHPFGTAKLAALGLERSMLLVDHAGCLRRDPSALGSLEGAALLYPHPDARDVTTLSAAERPRKLVVIDGTWHHARTLYRDIGVLRALPHLTLPHGLLSDFRIRKQPAPHCLSTIEAIVFALRSLEPETLGLDALLDSFRSMQDRQLAIARGEHGRQRKSVRSAASRALPRALAENYSALVVAYAEPCFERGEPRPLLCCAAERPSTGERAFWLIEGPGLGEAQLSELGLEPSALAQAVTPARFRAEWRAYLRDGDVLATWNTNALRTLNEAAGRPYTGIALKSAYNSLGRTQGSLEHIVRQELAAAASPCVELDPLPEPPRSGGRARERLEHALWLADFLHRHALGG
jgi:DTW domain-containing protein YfiP